MDYSVFIIGLLLGLIIGALIAFLLLKFGKQGREFQNLRTEKDLLIRSNEEQNRNVIQVKTEKEQIQEKLLFAREENASLKQRQKNLEEKLEEIEKMRDKREEEMGMKFQNLANKIFEDKSEKFDKNSKKNLDAILDPLKEKIKVFEDKVEKIYSDENKERINLKAEVKQLTELNKQLSQDANNLTSALKGDNKAQGNWGELILERVLESSGLEKGREYSFQYTENDEHGRPQRPDVVVKLPDNKHIIIDSKVSIVAYDKYVAAETNEEKSAFLKEHINSVKNHIKGLSEKNYQGLQNLNTPDFVLMFLPIEASLGLAAGNDENLWSYAWDKKIVLVSPATLLATLRTVSSIWKHENQNLNAIEIATQAGRMLDKFTDFTDDMIRLGNQMETSKKSYEKAMNKLSSGTGNLVKRSEQLKQLGVKTKKQVDKRIIDRAFSEEGDFGNEI